MLLERAAVWRLLALLALAVFPANTRAQAAGGATPEEPKEKSVYIQEYRVIGVNKLPSLEVEEAVYPYLGPARTAQDVEQARQALEKVYQEKGYQTVSVQIPPQQVRGGVVVLQVVEGSVGRLRVTGARYFTPSQIKKAVPSLAEGRVPNFNDVSREIVALNQLPDRKVTPTIRAGAIPGTVDVDLVVKDTLPLHGSVELNNRYSVNTTPLRLNAYASYNNLWQLGHSIGVSFQIAPQRPEDATIYSAYYIARLPRISWLSLMLQGTRQNSNVSTLGGGAVAGNGEVIGGRIIATLPGMKDFYHSLSFGLDYKHFTQDLMVGSMVVGTPITYYPFNLSYNAALAGKGHSTELTASIIFHFRGMGSAEEEFDNRRYNADGGFFYFRGSLSHTQDLPLGFQIFLQTQGQAAGQPLVDSEQFSGGGLDTVRGYLESEVLGDNALVGSVELRSPSPKIRGIDEWRVYGFVDGGVFTLNDPLPEQQSRFNLASVGLGSRIRLLGHLNGSLDAGVPLISQNPTTAGKPLLTFRLWGDF